MTKIIVKIMLILILTGSVNFPVVFSGNSFELSAIPECGLINLKWDTYDGAFGYYVYRGSGKSMQSGDPLTDFPLEKTVYRDKDGLEAKKDYCYFVTAIDSNYKEIARTPEVCVVSDCDSKKQETGCTLSLKYQVGETKYWVNEKEAGPMDTAPEIKLDRTFLVIKYVCDHISAKMNWDAKERKLTIQSKTGDMIEFWIGLNKYRFNGSELPLDENKPSVVPYISSGRTMIPLRKAGENLKSTRITWNPQTRIAELIFNDEDCTGGSPKKGVVDQPPVVQPNQKCDWAQLSGNVARTGKADDVCNPKTNTLEEKWNFFTGRMGEVSIPAIVDNKVIFGSVDSKLYCIDKNTRLKLWEAVTSAAITSSPAVSANLGKCWVGGTDNHMYCFDINNGQKIWDVDCVSPIVSSPLLVDDKILFGTIGNEESDGSLYCLSAQTGAVVWSKLQIGDIASSVSASARLGLVYVATGSTTRHDNVWDIVGHSLYCYNLNTGDQVWLSPQLSGPSTPIVDDSRTNVYFFNNISGWLYCLDASNGNIKYTINLSTQYDGTNYYSINRGGMALCDNKLVFGIDSVSYGTSFSRAFSKGFVCVDVVAGTVSWNVHLASDANVDVSLYGCSFPVICNNKIYIGTKTKDDGHGRFYRGSLYCLDLTNGNKLWNIGYGAQTSQDVSGVVLNEGQLYVASFWGLRVYAPK